MIEIDDLDIEIVPFKILPINNYFDLTTSKSKYTKNPFDGGIKVTPLISKINDTLNGYFYITQICNSHNLKIVSKGSKERTFDSNGQKYNDVHNDCQTHLEFYFIKNGIVDDPKKMGNSQIVFNDSPFMQLCPNWNEIHYKIEFETWFQYNNDMMNKLNGIKPLLSFKWYLNCVAVNIGDNWIITDSEFSNVDEIKNSMKRYTNLDYPLLPNELKLERLYTTIKNFLQNTT